MFSRLEARKSCFKDCNPYSAPALSDASIEILFSSIDNLYDSSSKLSMYWTEISWSVEFIISTLKFSPKSDFTVLISRFKDSSTKTLYSDLREDSPSNIVISLGVGIIISSSDLSRLLPGAYKS